MSEYDAVVEAVAESWASIDGKMELFRAEKGAFSHTCQWTGTYEGYMAEARELIRRMEKRGCAVVCIPPKQEASK